MFVSHAEVMARIPPKRRAAIERKAAKEIARLKAEKAKIPASASPAPSSGAKSPPTPIAAAPAGK